MQLTGIGEQNIDYFKRLLPQNYDINDIMVGAMGYGRAVGAASFSLVGSAIYMDHIFVDPDYRRKGVGSELIKSFASEMKKIVVGAIHTDYFEGTEGIKPFLSSLGFVSQEDGEVWSVPIESFFDSPVMKRYVKKREDNRLVCLGEMTKTQMADVKECLSKLIKDPEEFFGSGMDDRLSMAAFDNDTNAMDACIFCTRREELITISFLSSLKNDPVDLMEIVGGLRDAACEQGIKTGKLRFVSMDDRIADFAKKLAGSPEDLKHEGAMYSAVLSI